MNPTKSSARIVRAFTWWLLALGLAGQSAFAVTIAVNEGTSTSTVIYTATDQASGATYSLTGTDASSFTINSSGQVKFQSVPNYETKTSYSFTINTIVSGSTHSTETVVVNVNDLAPVISSGSTTSINEGVAVNSVVYTTTAADPAGGTV
ncbi:MAG TPA: cadherin repeat domain-containing protein, partial [Desulfuromonadaceae bacterium]|nr:cadherin repeat domain-containing protein [Desulfuromonadaceae bacterium]